jgi:hypothetical protein
VVWRTTRKQRKHIDGRRPRLVAPMNAITERPANAWSCSHCTVRNQNIEADGCGGQVKIQSFATFRIRTENGNNTQTIYGEPKDL